MCKKFVQRLLGADVKPPPPAADNVTVDKGGGEADVKNSEVVGALNNAGQESSGRVKLGGKRRMQGTVPGLSI